MAGTISIVMYAPDDEFGMVHCRWDYPSFLPGGAYLSNGKASMSLFFKEKKTLDKYYRWLHFGKMIEDMEDDFVTG